MRGLWIALGVLAALALLVWRLRVGVRASFGQPGVLADLKIGPFAIRLAPRPKAPEGTPQKRERAAERGGGEPPAKKFPRPTAADLRDAWRARAPPAKRALARTRRSIRITPLRLSVTVGGAEDPADAAELYGALNAAVWTLMPALERLADVPDPSIHTGIDFDAARTKTEGELELSVRLGTLIAVGFTLGLPAVKWLKAYLKRHKSRQTAGKTAERQAA